MPNLHIQGTDPSTEVRHNVRIGSLIHQCARLEATEDPDVIGVWRFDGAFAGTFRRSDITVLRSGAKGDLNPKRRK